MLLDSENNLKLADCGLSKLVHPGETMMEPCGTLSYVAPEVLAMQGYGMEADLWSIGVILWLVVRGRLPFGGEDKDTVVRRTLEARLDFSHSVWAAWSAALASCQRKKREREKKSVKLKGRISPPVLLYLGGALGEREERVSEVVEAALREAAKSARQPHLRRLSETPVRV